MHGKFYTGTYCKGDDGGGPRWTDYKMCGQTDGKGKPQAYGVCGLKTRIQEYTALYDDGGLTDIQLVCCKDPKCKRSMGANVLLYSQHL